MWTKPTRAHADGDVNALLAGAQWQSQTLTYSFPTSASSYGSNYDEANTGFEKFTDRQIAATERVLADIASFTGLRFTEVSGGLGVLRFAETNATEVAHAYLPWEDERGGDVWFNNSAGIFENPVRGSYAYFGFQHEIGHALGLEHPHETLEPMSAAHDAMDYTVMSYRSYRGAPLEGYTNREHSFAQTFMTYDIAALQHMYGANFGHNSGNTRYSWDPSTGAFSINGSVQWRPVDNVVYMTVWDGGGTDTYDFSNHVVRVVVDLEPGAWTSLANQRAQLGPGEVAAGSIANAFLFEGNTRSLIENAVGGRADDKISGNQAANRLDGGGSADQLDGRAGNDVLIGGKGADRMAGGAGDDVFHVDDARDAVSELPGEGLDIVKSSVSYVLPDGVEQLLLTGTAAKATGNALANLLTGTAGANELKGGAGDDVLRGGAGKDLLDGGADFDIASYAGAASGVTVRLGGQASGGAGADTLVNIEGLIGSSHADSLWGDSQANKLDGGPGADRLAGGDGNDDYVVDNLGDVITETADGGEDTVMSSISYKLTTAHVEYLTLIGTAAINATGGSGHDRIFGNPGANVLDGGAGADMILGGDGDDTYVVDNAGDEIMEDPSQGTDTVRSSISFHTPAHVERLILVGGAIAGSGNAAANILIGNAAANRLDGGDGDDSMRGGGGNDIYVVGSPGDDIVEKAGGGMDTVEAFVNYVLPAQIERLELMGWVTRGTGNAAANRITGNEHSNWLDGGAGADRLIGGAGGDTYFVDHRGDVIVETGGPDIDTVISSIGYTLGGALELLVLTGRAVAGTGNGLRNSITGNDAANRLDGRGDGDTLTGGKGSDTYVVDHVYDRVVEQAGQGRDTVESSISYTLAPNVENLTLTGPGAIEGWGNDLDNVIVGGSGSNVLNGGAGADLMTGGGGSDTYHVDDAGDRVVDQALTGFDRVISTISYSLAGQRIEMLVLSGDQALNGTGNALANILRGNSSANRLDGGAGADQMDGSDGDDVYIVDHRGDAVTDSLGWDTVRSSISYTLDNDLEALVLIGTGAINGIGNYKDNSLTGNDAANRLNGKDGADIMAGGKGRDTYIVDDAGDQVIELAGEGYDTVETNLDSYSLAGTAVEKLVLTGWGGNSGTGNGLANVIVGHFEDDVLDGAAGADQMIGGAGDDIFYVDDVGDRVVELASDEGHDVVYSSVSFSLAGTGAEDLIVTSSTAVAVTGNASINLLVGNDADNRLDGRAAADEMRGGGGNDLYFVDDAWDEVIETAGGGTDKVKSSAQSYELDEKVENLELIGNAVYGYGNGLANRIVGNDGDNIIDGRGGVDILIGGQGDDVYRLDNVAEAPVERRGEGRDTVESSVSHVLPANVENLVLTERWTGHGYSDLNGTGNGLANELIGHEGRNVLDGRGGADRMVGGRGEDTYIVDDAGDTIIEGFSSLETDAVMTSLTYFALPQYVENLTYTGLADFIGIGTSYNNVMTGSTGNDSLRSAGGRDRLFGRGGTDILTGGTNADEFVFDTDPAVEAGADSITDFSAAEDSILLDISVFTEIAAGVLADAAFCLGTQALDADDRIVCDVETGNVFYDADGSGEGAAILFVQVTAGTPLTSADFIGF